MAQDWHIPHWNKNDITKTSQGGFLQATKFDKVTFSVGIKMEHWGKMY